MLLPTLSTKATTLLVTCQIVLCADFGEQFSLATQNAVQQRHHARCVRASGFSGEARRAVPEPSIRVGPRQSIDVMRITPDIDT